MLARLMSVAQRVVGLPSRLHVTAESGGEADRHQADDDVHEAGRREVPPPQEGRPQGQAQGPRGLRDVHAGDNGPKGRSVAGQALSRLAQEDKQPRVVVLLRFSPLTRMFRLTKRTAGAIHHSS